MLPTTKERAMRDFLNKGMCDHRQYSDKLIYFSTFLFFILCTLRHLSPFALQTLERVGIVGVSRPLEYVGLNDMVSSYVFLNAQMLTLETRRTLSASSGNEIILKRLCGHEIFIAGRGGDAELLIIEDLLQRTTPRVRQFPRRHSGIYPETDLGLQNFGNAYYDALRALTSGDIFAVFTRRQDVEDVVLKQTLSKSVEIVHEDSLSPFWFDNPWSSCLRNKVVLIVHPFIDSIKCQLRRRSHIFPNSPNVLPPFEVKFVKSFQCMGEERLPHKDWNETMHATMRLVDEVGHFDVALIAAGSYGLPLAVYCKYAKGATALVIGGSLQQLFGLRGMRWEHLYPTGYKYPNSAQNGTHGSMYNQDWMFPLKVDTVKNPMNIELGSPYWGPETMQFDKCPYEDS